MHSRSSLMKRVALFIIFLLMFQLVSGIGPVFAEGGDGTPPEVLSVELSSKEIAVGEKLTVKADVRDDLSGVRVVSARFNSPSNNKTLTIRLTLNPVTNLFEGSYQIDVNDEGGLWTFHYISAHDNASNMELYYAESFRNSLDYMVLNEGGDGAPPEVISLELSSKEVNVGEKLTVKADVRDDLSGVRVVSARFNSPSNNKTLTIRLTLNPVTNLFEGSYQIDVNDEGGLWTFHYISAHDNASNMELYYAESFQNSLDYTVLNEGGDGAPPEVISLELSSKEVNVGEKLTVKADVRDDLSGVRVVSARFNSPSNNKTLTIRLTLNPVTNLFEGSYQIDVNDEGGLWTFHYISAHDNASNMELYYAKDFQGISENLNFIVTHGESDLENTTINDSSLPYAIVTKNEAWQNKTIDKDLYIGPNSTITIADDVTITGNVYVYGTLISHGGLTILGSLNAKAVTYGSTSYAAPGAVRIIGGQNSISSTVVSNQPYEVPFKIYNENLTNETGPAVIEGKTLPFLDVTMQGNPVSLETDGSFKAMAEQVTSDGIQFNLRDVFGNDIKKEIAVIDVLPPAAVQNFAVTKTTPNEIQVSWNASAEKDLKGYEVYLNGDLVESLPAVAAEYTFSGLQEGTAYKVAIAAADFSDNVSAIAEAAGTTSLSKPIVNPISDKATSITGKASPDTTVSIEKGESIIGSGSTNSNGEFNINIPTQKTGTELYVTASNEAGIVSEKTLIIVEDKTAPAPPKVTEVTDNASTVTGTAEAQVNVIVKAGSTVLGSSIAGEDGNYVVTIAKQKAGTKLTVIATDQASNISGITDVIVVDGAAPAVSLMNKVTHHSTRIIGTAEAAAKIVVKAGTTTIGSATANSKGKYEVSIEKQKVGTKLSIIATDAAGNSSAAIPVTVADGNYPDLKVTHWALDEIMYLADDQIIGGYPGGGFQPEKNTTRAEAAKMLALAMDLPIPDAPSGYKDVTDKHWAKNYIAAVSEAGLFNGNPDGTFAPNNVLKRAEMAKVISIAYKLGASDKNHFSDVKNGYWAKGYISGLYENGITTGFPDKTFHPVDPTTRAEYSVFLARALNADFR